MTEKNSPRRDPIVARRDGDLGQPTQPDIRDSFASVEEHAPKNGSTLILIIVLLLTACLAGLGWFSWQQSQAQELLQKRFDDLAAKIDSTDESLNQSGAALTVRVSNQQKELTKHWSEIRKLWGVTNDRNKKAIAELQQANAKSAKKRVELTTKISVLSAELSAEQKKLTTMVGELGSDSLASVARIDEVGERVNQLNGSQQRLSLSVDKRRRALENRIQSVENAIESIDSFRRQTNQALDALRQAPAIP